MSATIKKYDKYLMLEYLPNYGDEKFFNIFYEGLFEEGKGSYIKKTFYMDKKIYTENKRKLKKLKFDNDINTLYFIIAEKENSFYKLNKKILNIDFDLYISEKINITTSLFYKNIGSSFYSVFRPFNRFYKNKQLYVVLEKEDDSLMDESLEFKCLEKCISQIPTTHGVQLFRDSVYTNVLRNYIDVKDMGTALDKHISKKIKSVKGKIINEELNKELFYKINLIKYKNAVHILEEMIKNETIYIESDWQKEIIKIFKLINPKYIYIGEKLVLKNFYEHRKLETDLVLVDFAGNIDLIEIKKPNFDLVYKREYRNNYIPTRELQGTCVQLQNYLLSLQKTSREELNKSKFKKLVIPDNLELQAIMPKGYIIYGTNKQLKDPKIMNDFQIIKNMYLNIIDIMTYDDLILRLKNLINSIK